MVGYGILWMGGVMGYRGCSGMGGEVWWDMVYYEWQV